MSDKPTLYLESSIPSYLAAYPSRDLIVASHQQISSEWWQQARPNFEIYLSQAVLDEIGAGDPDAASRRLTFSSWFGITKSRTNPQMQIPIRSVLLSVVRLPLSLHRKN
jgi:hypothetical protein